MEAGEHFYRQTLARFSGVFSELFDAVGSSAMNTTWLPVSQDSTIQDLQSDVLCSFKKQEYFRKAYNETVERIDRLKYQYPEFAAYANQLPVEQEDEELQEDDVEMSPEMVEFMLETMRHREERDRQRTDRKSTEHAPPVKRSQPPVENPSCDRLSRLEADIFHYYTCRSPCRDSVFWPFLPLRKD